MPHIAFWRDRATAYEAISLAERLVLEGRAVASPPRWVFTIPACDAEGFSIRLDIDRFGSHGWIGGIEEEFDSIRAAFALVRYALNEHCRLRIMVAGGKPKEWILEHRADRNWQALLAARTFEFTSLFTRKEVFIRHNRFGSADRQTVMP